MNCCSIFVYVISSFFVVVVAVVAFFFLAFFWGVGGGGGGGGCSWFCLYCVGPIAVCPDVHALNVYVAHGAPTTARGHSTFPRPLALRIQLRQKHNARVIS